MRLPEEEDLERLDYIPDMLLEAALIMRENAAKKGVRWELGDIPDKEEVLSRDREWEKQVRIAGEVLQFFIDKKG